MREVAKASLSAAVTKAGLRSRELKKPFAQVILRPESGHQAKAFLSQTAVSHTNRIFSTEVHC